MSARQAARRTVGAGIAAASVALVGSLSGASAPSTPSAAAPPALVVNAALPALSRTTVPAASTRQSARVTRASRVAARRTAAAASRTSFAAFTLSSPATRDMRGVERSLYRGRFYHRATEAVRLCVVKRESEGHYDVVSPSGAYAGAYQVSAPLARGVTWMLLREHRGLLGPKVAKRVLARLRDRPMNTWPRYWQDAAFFTVMNWEGHHSGRSHWAGGRWSC